MRSESAFRSHPNRDGVARSLGLAALVVLAIAAALPACSDAAPSLERFAMSVGGESTGPLGTCTTFIAPAPINAFFGGGMGLPIGGLAACGVAGGFDDATALHGPLAVSYPLTSTWRNGSFSGTADATADYGVFRASAHSTFTGSRGSLTVDASESFGRANDALTITSPGVPNGQSGTFRIVFTVIGGLSTTANGTADVELAYQYGPSIYTMFRSQVNDAVSLPFIAAIAFAGTPAFTSTPGAMSGSAQASTFAHSFVFGTPFDFNTGMFVYTIPGASGSVLDAHFFAYVSAIEVLGPGGAAVANASISSASGATYGTSGVTAVAPAPSDDVALTASPNPTPGATRLRFRLPASANARLEVYDAAGRLVRRLSDALREQPGAQVVLWDGRDDRGARVPRGAYYARLRWADSRRTLRVTRVD